MGIRYVVHERIEVHDNIDWIYVRADHSTLLFVCSESSVTDL